MAKKTAAVDIKVNSGNSVQEVIKLTDTIKTLKDEVGNAEKNFIKMQQEFGKTSDQAALAKQKFEALRGELRLNEIALDDVNKKVNERFKTITETGAKLSAGFAAVQGTMALLGSESEDLQKTMVKLQAALAISQGLEQLKDAGRVFSDFKKLALDAFDKIKTAFLANPFFLTIGAVLLAAAGAMAVLSANTDGYTELVEENTKALEENLAVQKEKNDTVIRGLNREIAEAKAAGKETVELERAKLEVQIRAAEERIKLIIKVRDAEKAAFKEVFDETAQFADKLTDGKISKKFTDDQKNRNKEIKSLQEDLKDFQSGLTQLTLSEETEKNDKALENYKDYLDKRAALDEAYRKEKEALDEILQRKENEQRLTDALKDFTNFQEIDRSIRTTVPQAIQEVSTESIALWEELVGNLNSLTSDFVKFNESETGKLVAANVNLLDNSLGQLDQLFQMSTQNQIDAANGNEKKQEEIRKKAFERDKALRIAQAVMDTFKSSTNALATVPVPFNFLAAAANAAFGAIQIAQIRKQQYKGAGGGGGDLPTTSAALSLPEFANQPTINTTDINQQQADQSGQQLTSQVYITQGQLENNQLTEKSLQSKVQIQ